MNLRAPDAEDLNSLIITLHSSMYTENPDLSLIKKRQAIVRLKIAIKMNIR